MEKNKKIKIIISIVIGIIIFLLLVISTIFGLINEKSTKIIGGVYINNIDVSNLSKEEAITKINQKIEEKNKEEIKTKYNDEEYEEKIDRELIEIKYKVEESVEEAYSVGRYSSIVINNFNIIKTKLAKEHIKIDITYNEEELKNVIDNINIKLPNAVKETDYYIEDTNLIITRGKEGLSVDENKFKEELLNVLSNFDNMSNNINIPVISKTPSEIDIEKIYEEIHKEAKDAYYTKDPFQIYSHVVGVDLAIPMEEVKSMISQKEEQYKIPLKITMPEITTDKLGTEAFPDLLSTYTTKYNAGDTARTTNLSIASRKINGTVLMPGETFSYNKALGERTIAAGYKEAKVYEGGRVVDGLGGGICQISSTLYNSVVFANLEIVVRRNHQFVPSYVTAGRDATVVYGVKDFKFKNNRNYPVKIVSSVSRGVAKVSIYGTKEETEYKVDIQTTITGTIPMKTVYVEDSNLEKGKEVVKQKGHNGTKSQTYKILYLNGKLVSRTLLSTDTYNAMQTIITVGTKELNNTTDNTVNNNPDNNDNTNNKDNENNNNNNNDSNNENNGEDVDTGNNKKEDSGNTDNNGSQDEPNTDIGNNEEENTDNPEKELEGSETEIDINNEQSEIVQE